MGGLLITMVWLCEKCGRSGTCLQFRTGVKSRWSWSGHTTLGKREGRTQAMLIWSLIHVLLCDMNGVYCREQRCNSIQCMMYKGSNSRAIEVPNGTVACMKTWVLWLNQLFIKSPLTKERGQKSIVLAFILLILSLLVAISNSHPSATTGISFA